MKEKIIEENMTPYKITTALFIIFCGIILCLFYSGTINLLGFITLVILWIFSFGVIFTYLDFRNQLKEE